jgi:hypothetical protein
MVIQTPTQKALAILGVVSGLIFVGWVSKYSLTKKLMLLRAGEDSVSQYHAYVITAIISDSIFLVGGILAICAFIWPEWFERFNRK